MTVYWIDPHTTTNGTGTYASPFSFNSNVRANIANNDELRLKGVALTSLLTATSYTGTWSGTNNYYNITVTSGGSLGADFAAWDIVYFPDYDVFSRISSVAGNILSVNSGGMWPIPNSTDTTLNFRKVNKTTYTQGWTGSQIYFFQSQSDLESKTGVVVSDCWTSETTRVTDGTVKTLCWSTTTSGPTVYTTQSSTIGYRTTATFNLQNTHFVHNQGSSSPTTLNINNVNSTFNLNQIQNMYMYSGTLYINGNDNTVNFKSIQSSISANGANNIVNVTNLVQQQNSFNYMLVSSSYSGGNEFNYDTISFVNPSSGFINLGGAYTPYKLSFKTIDQWSNSQPTSFIYTGNSNGSFIEIEFKSGTVFYKNRRAATLTGSNFTNFLECSTQLSSFPVVPTTNLPSFTYSYKYKYPYLNYGGGSYYFWAEKNTPALATTILPDSGSTNTGVQHYGNQYGPVNTTLTYKDGTADPIEYLGYFNCPYTSGIPIASVPTVSRDIVVYRTAAPSLKINLATYSPTYCVAGTNTTFSRKTIKIPVVSGTPISISGYIRTNSVNYINGYCKAEIIAKDTVVAYQDMTTACENAWEQFTLSYTPTYTGEAYFSLRMTYVEAANYWLDDLTIS